MRRWLLLALLALIPGLAHAQNAWVQVTAQQNVFTPTGLVVRAIPNATVTVCSSAGAGTPCTPLATVCISSTSCTAAPNPFQTDANGNAGFWIAPGTYTYSVTANNVTGQLFNVTAGGGGGGGSGTVQSGTTGLLPVYPSSTPTVGPSTVQIATVSQKPHISDAAQYVTANGNDSNDGLSWGTAKLTLYGAMLALPGGSATTLIAGSGTINVQTGATNINAGGPEGGVMLIGANDIHWPGTQAALSSCVRSSNVVTLTFAGAHHYSVTWSSGITYVAGNPVLVGSQNYVSLVNSNLNNAPASTLGTDWALLGASTGGQFIQLFGTTGGATSFNGTFTITGGTSTTITYAQTGPNESCTVGAGAVIPAGFLYENATPGVNFVAKGSTQQQTSPGTGNVTIVSGGTGSPTGVPFATIELAGTNGSYLSDGIIWRGCIPGPVMGTDSNFVVDSFTSTFSPTFKNGGSIIAFTNNKGCGPDVEIGSNVLFNFISNWTFDAEGEQWSQVASITRSSNVSTATLSSPMTPGDIQVGDIRDVFGASDASYNSTLAGFTVLTVPDTTHFTYGNLGANCASACVTGTIQTGLNPENNRRAAVLFAVNGINSDLHLENVTFDGGGVRALGGGLDSGIFGFGWQGEGSNPHSQPNYECFGTTACPTAHLIFINGISDSADNPPVIKVPPGNAIYSTTVDCIGNAAPIIVQGPALVNGCLMLSSSASSNTHNVSPPAMGQQGFFIQNQSNRARLWMQADDVRRAGSPVAVRFPNVAATAPGSWTNVTGGNLTITTAVSDALGGAGAANLSVSTGNGEADSYSGTRTVKSGDYFIAGVWFQVSSTAGVNNNFFHNGPLQITFSNANTKGRGIGYNIDGTAAGTMESNPYTQDDSSWQWVSTWDSVTTPDASETVKLKHFVNTAFPENLYAPILLHVPLATLDAQCAATCEAALTSVASGGGFANWTTTSTNFFKLNQIVCPEGVTDTSYDGCTKILAITSGTVFQTAYSGGSTSSSGGTAYATADSEAADIAQNVATYSNQCVVTQSCTVNGPVAGTAFSTKSSAYTLVASDYWVNVTGNTTIKAPHAIPGQPWVVFNSGSGTVTLEADSGNFNGTTSVSLSANTGMQVTCDGTNCFGH